MKPSNFLMVSILLTILIFNLFLIPFITFHSYKEDNKYLKLINRDEPFTNALIEGNYLFDWNITWGGSLDDDAKDIAIDDEDNAYIVAASSSFSLDAEAHVAKFSPTGDLIWNVSWGYPGYVQDVFYALALDSYGDLYVTGRTGSYFVLIKYSSAGVQQWNKTRSDIHCGCDIAINSTDYIYTIGYGSSNTPYIICFTNNGDLLWNKSYSTYYSFSSITIDELGYLYIGGEAQYVVGGDVDLFLAKYDCNGKNLWYRSYGGDENIWIESIALDPSGNIYLTGRNLNVPDSYGDAYLVKYNSAGTMQWERTWGYYGDFDSFNRVISDSSGYLYVSGFSRVGGDRDVIFLKYNTNGTILFEKSWGGSDLECAEAMVMDSKEDFILTGYTTSYGYGEEDAFLLKTEHAAPQITISSPKSYSLFGNSSIYYSLSVIEPNMDTIFYSLNKKINITATGIDGIIDQAAWDTCGNGTVAIKFYVNDTAGNLGFAEVIVRKDINLPFIVIKSPEINSLFGESSPSFDLLMNLLTIDCSWYSLNDGLNYTFIGTSGQILQTAWDSCSDGYIKITFYCNDTISRLARNNVNIRKDSTVPYIFFNKPTENEIFYYNTPTFNLSINEPNLEKIWYFMDNGNKNITCSIFGKINQTLWNSHKDGRVVIKFFANDTLGHLGFQTIVVWKLSDIPLGGWNKTWHKTIYECGYSIEIASSGNIYVGGIIDNSGIFKTLLLKFDAFGNEIWNRTWGYSNSYQGIKDICLDSSENIYCTGTIEVDIFVLKYDLNGNLLWNRTYNSGSPDTATCIGLNSNNYVIIGGTKDSLNFDMQMVVYTSTGSFAGSKTWHDTPDGQDRCYDLVIDSSDYIYMVGYTGEGFNQDLSIVKWNMYGTVSWKQRFGLNGDETAYGVTLDGNENLFVVGTTNSYGNGGEDAILIKYNSSDGALFWNQTWGGSYNDRFSGVSVDNASNIYVGGYSESFGQGDINFCLGSYNSTANLQGFKIWGNNQSNYIERVNIDSNDTLYLVGYTDVSYSALNYDVYIVKTNVKPTILIQNPYENQVFGTDSPEFDVYNYDPFLNTTWYTINGSKPYFYVGNSGLLNQTEWDALGSGYIILEFYANNTFGEISSTRVNVDKDLDPPTIYIITPNDGTFFGLIAPNYIVEIRDKALNTMWYSINDILNQTFTVNGTFRQDWWQTLSNGSVTITFYANDSFGHISSDSTSFWIDAISPTISLNIPKMNEIFNNSAPYFDIYISDPHFNNSWYSLSGGDNVTFLTNESLNQDLWILLPDGNILLNFYANDSFGNLGSIQTIIIKDSTKPSIKINSPDNDSYYADISPNFNLELIDAHLNKTWYTINGGPKIFFNLNGSIDQENWTLLSDGQVTLKFFANDSINNLETIQINLIKDTVYPSLSIISPIFGQFFGATAPSFIVEIYDDNLKSMWYSLDYGLNQTFLINGTFRQDWWSNLVNGSHIILFYANDSTGHETKVSQMIYIDILAPLLNVLNPYNDQIFDQAPNFIIEISDNHLAYKWYLLNSDPNKIFFNTNETINNSRWNSLLDGNVNITFYANDSFNNSNSTTILVIKDTTAPDISVASPEVNTKCGIIAPKYEISCTDYCLDTIWYTLDNGKNNYIITQPTGNLDQHAWESVWNAISFGETISLRFYANDSFDHLNTTQITLIKYDFTPSGDLDDDDNSKNGSSQDSEFDIIEYLTSPIGVVIEVISFGLIISIIFVRKKSKYKASTKERRRIGELWD